MLARRPKRLHRFLEIAVDRCYGQHRCHCVLMSVPTWDGPEVHNSLYACAWNGPYNKPTRTATRFSLANMHLSTVFQEDNVKYAPFHIANYTQGLVPPRAHGTRWLGVVALVVRTLLRPLVVRWLNANVRGNISSRSLVRADMSNICRVLYVELRGYLRQTSSLISEKTDGVPHRHARNYGHQISQIRWSRVPHPLEGQIRS